jgi:hypothetical protein
MVSHLTTTSSHTRKISEMNRSLVITSQPEQPLFNPVAADAILTQKFSIPAYPPVPFSSRRRHSHPPPQAAASSLWLPPSQPADSKEKELLTAALYECTKNEPTNFIPLKQ